MNYQASHIVKSVIIAFVFVTSICACNQATKTTDTKTDSVAKADSAAKAEDAGVVGPHLNEAGKLVGAWHDETIKSEKGEQIAYEVVTDGKKVYIQAITFVGTNLKLNDTPPITAAASEIVKDGDQYHSVERPAEVYKIDKNGDLLIYDGAELVAKCKKLI